MRPIPPGTIVLFLIAYVMAITIVSASDNTNYYSKHSFGKARFLKEHENANCTHATCRKREKAPRARQTRLLNDDLNTCDNIGFETGTFDGWIGKYGSQGVIEQEGFVNSRHRIFSGGNDPLVNSISTVAPGSTHSVRLGNKNSDYEIDQLVTSFEVTENNTLFSYQFAVVLEDPGHEPEYQPRFEIAAYDEAGTIIPCGYYLVVAAEEIDGFQSKGNIRYRDWSTVGIDLSDYIGEIITITFTTVDCAQGAHFGYAYIDAECLVSELTIECNDPEVCEEGASYCAGASNITLTAPDGFANYNWSTGGTGRSININNPVPGDLYEVSFNNINSANFDTCLIELSIEIPDGNPPEVFVADTLYFCDGDSLNIDAGEDLENILWSTGETTPIITTVQGGYYEVSFTYNGGCAGKAGIDAVAGAPPDVQLEAIDPSCFGSSDGSVVSQVMTTLGEVQYEWENGNNTHSIQDLEPGNYCLTVTDRAGCATDTCIELVDPPELVSRVEALDNICFGARDGKIEIVGNGGLEPYLYSFNNAPFQERNIYENLAAGTYFIQTQDINGCLTQDTIQIDEPIELQVDAGADVTIPLGEGVQLLATTNYPVGIYAWKDSLNLSCFDCPDPSVRPLNTKEYVIEVTDDKGCKAEDAVTIFVTKEYSIYIPNAFSPNGDAVNDVFYIFTGGEVTQIKSLEIFDRWGEKLFSQRNFLPNDPEFGWNGLHQGKIMNPGVFVYYIEVEFIDAAIKQFKGDVTLLR